MPQPSQARPRLPAPALLLWTLLFIWIYPASATSPPGSAGGGELEFIDQPLEEAIVLPDWFKLSFLELHDDLADALRNGKRGLILYFGQKDCPYCKALLDNNWGRADIATYTRRHFDVVGIDVKGDRLVTRFDGVVQSEQEFSSAIEVEFTPTLLFYDADGKLALRLTGYHPAYLFRAALEFTADGHYRTESFREYVARGDLDQGAGQTDLRHRDWFSPPPYALDRSRMEAQRPLVVFFEETSCHPCDVLHLGPLARPAVRRLLDRLDTAQLDMWSDTPVWTPDGKRQNAREWADRLGLFYAPTLVFFDEQGREILRVDSVLQLYRLQGILEYVTERAYRQFPNFRRWRDSRGNMDAVVN